MQSMSRKQIGLMFQLNMVLLKLICRNSPKKWGNKTYEEEQGDLFFLLLEWLVFFLGSQDSPIS